MIGLKRVVNPVIIGAHQQPPKRAETEFDVGMRYILPSVGYQRQHSDLDCRKPEQDRHGDRHKKRQQDISKEMLACGRRDIHVLVAMMQQMLLPENFAAVFESVLPILKEIENYGRDQYRKK